MDKRTQLGLLRILSIVFTMIVAILFVLAVHSSFIDPLINRTMFIELPSEDDIIWSFEDDYLLAETGLTMENTGFYDMRDITITYDLFALERTLFSDTIRVNRLSVGESKEVPVSMAVRLEDVEDEMLEEFVFNTTDFKIRSRLTARYPFTLMHLELRYDETLEWDGLVKTLEFEYEGVSVTSLDQEGSVLSIPFEVETNDLLEGDAYVDVTMYDETMTEAYSAERITVPLGVRYKGEISFELNKDITEVFITDSRKVQFISEITLSGVEMSFEHTTEYEWGAPLNDLAVGNAHRTLDQVRADFSFHNDSPRFLELELDIRVFDIGDQLVGTQTLWLNAHSGQYVETTIFVEIDGVPTHVEVDIFEHGTGVEYRAEVVVDP